MTPHPLTVLIVEDDDATRAALAELLAGHGCEPWAAADGQEALDLLARVDRPCVILLDWLMPRLGGEAFLAFRAACPVLSSIPVIAMSATHDIADDARIQGFLAKPFTVGDLKRRLRTICETGCTPSRRSERRCDLPVPRTCAPSR